LSHVPGALARFASNVQPHAWLADSLLSDLITPADHLCKSVVVAPRTAPAIAFVSEHYGEIIRLETTARLCRLSASEFSRVFHHEHNISFRQLPLNCRIAMACDFLAEPGASISQVDYAVGSTTCRVSDACSGAGRRTGHALPAASPFLGKGWKMQISTAAQNRPTPAQIDPNPMPLSGEMIPCPATLCRV
jgi:AraC-like DNA-binding protein